MSPKSKYSKEDYMKAFEILSAFTEEWQQAMYEANNRFWDKGMPPGIYHESHPTTYQLWKWLDEKIWPKRNR